MPAITVRILSNRIAELSAALGKNAEGVVRDAAKDGRDFASAISPVRTGALQASWYVSGPNEESDYPEHSSAAAGLNPQAVILEEARASFVEPDLVQPVAIISSAVNYSIFIEEGTRYMAPQPVLRPTAEHIRAILVNGMKGIAG